MTLKTLLSERYLLAAFVSFSVGAASTIYSLEYQDTRPYIEKESEIIQSNLDSLRSLISNEIQSLKNSKDTNRREVFREKVIKIKSIQSQIEQKILILEGYQKMGGVEKNLINTYHDMMEYPGKYISGFLALVGTGGTLSFLKELRVKKRRD